MEILGKALYLRMTKRAFAGAIAILMSIYFGVIVKKYIRKEVF